jgi:DNA-binding transcriptional LysR family regulator
MAPSIAQMRSFVAIAKEGSFTRAARSIHLSQPALTVQIRQLEEALQVKLLDRNTRSVQLTRVGEELAPVFERLLHELDTVVGAAKEIASKRFGIVRIACLPSLAATALPIAIGKFRARYPGVEFMVKDAVGAKIVSMVRSGTVDFGITAGEVGGADLETAVMMRDRMHAIYLAPHPLERETKITAEKLSGYPLILMDEESSVRQIVERAFRAEGLSVKPAIEPTYMSTAVGMVRARLGVALLPSTAVEARPAGKLRSRPVSGAHFVRTISIVRRTGRTLPPASAAFLAILGPQR